MDWWAGETGSLCALCKTPKGEREREREREKVRERERGDSVARCAISQALTRREF